MVEPAEHASGQEQPHQACVPAGIQSCRPTTTPMKRRGAGDVDVEHGPAEPTLIGEGKAMTKPVPGERAKHAADRDDGQQCPRRQDQHGNHAA